MFFYFTGMQSFIDKIRTLPDVYFVTISQVLQWTQNPARLDDMIRTVSYLGKISKTRTLNFLDPKSAL